MAAGGPEQTEAALLVGELPCPDCSAQLRPHGHARPRAVRGLGDARLTVRGHGAPAALIVAAPRSCYLPRGPRAGRYPQGHLDRAGGLGRGQRISYGRSPNGPAILDRAPLAASGTPNAHPLPVREGGTAHVPPQSRNLRPSQVVDKPARLELEYIVQCCAGLPPPCRPRAAALDSDRALHTWKLAEAAGPHLKSDQTVLCCALKSEST